MVGGQDPVMCSVVVVTVVVGKSTEPCLFCREFVVDAAVLAKRRVMRLPGPHLLSLFDLGLPATTSAVRPAQTLHHAQLAPTSHQSSGVVSLGPKCWQQEFRSRM